MSIRLSVSPEPLPAETCSLLSAAPTRRLEPMTGRDRSLVQSKRGDITPPGVSVISHYNSFESTCVISKTQEKADLQTAC